VTATVLQSLGHCLGDLIVRVLVVEPQNADELSHTFAIRPFLPQMSQQTLVDRRPTLPPASNWLGVVERTGSLFQDGQVVQGIENVLLPVVAPWMAGDDVVQVERHVIIVAMEIVKRKG